MKYIVLDDIKKSYIIAGLTKDKILTLQMLEAMLFEIISSEN